MDDFMKRIPNHSEILSNIFSEMKRESSFKENIDSLTKRERKKLFKKISKKKTTPEEVDAIMKALGGKDENNKENGD